MAERKMELKLTNSLAKVTYVSLLMLATPSFTNASETLAKGNEVSLVAQQTKTISGVVKDAKGEPIIGANVVVKGTTNGQITDFDGRFTISNVSANAVLQISYVGYATQEVTVGNKSNLDIVLAEDTETLQEVVVVGYGTTVKKDLTTAVTSVSSKDFLQGAVNDPMQMIDGKVAGVSMSSVNAADPNSSASLQVRGAGSLNAGNGPLIVIDGMPGGELRNLSQQDIESITVLKDGSAAAIYGSRAANGVILVTTKSGKAGKTTITYDGYIEHDFVASRPDMLSTEEFLEKVNGAVDHGSSTDWYGALLNENNFGMNHNVSISGGSENTIFRLSGNFRDKEGMDLVANRKEYGVRGNFKHTTLEGLLEVSGNINYRIADGENNGEKRTFSMAFVQNPTFAVDSNEMGYDYYNFNPVTATNTQFRKDHYEYATVDLNVRLNLLDNLYTEVKLGRQSRQQKYSEYKYQGYRECQTENVKGKAYLRHEEYVDWTFEWTGNYNFKIADEHDFKLMGGYSYVQSDYEQMEMDNRDFPSDALTFNHIGAGKYQQASGRTGFDSNKSREKTIAFLGRLNYNWKDLVLFTGSMRYEGNTKFGDGNKWGLFPAASAAFRLSQLSFLQDNDIVDDLKVRASWGVTGRSGFGRYTALAKYSSYGMYWSDYVGGFLRGYGPGNNPNSDLKWEKQISYNFGLDYTLFNSRLSGSIDFFIREGKDLISNYDVPMPPYLHSQITTNVGTTQAKGVELQVNWDAVKKEDFSYSTNVTLSYAKSKLKTFSNEKYHASYMDGSGFPSPGNPGSAQRLAEGIEIGTFYMSRYAGVNENGDILIWKDGKVGGETKLGTDANENDKVYLDKTGMPKWELAWGNTFTYKDFDLSLFFRGKFGYHIMNQYEMYYGLQVVSGGNLLHSAFEENAHIKGAKVMCDYEGFLQKGDYLRLDNITLGWSPKINSKWISNLRVYSTLKNVFTLTSYTGMDVTNVPTTGIWPGIGGMEVYPSARNLTFGVQITY